VSAHVSDLPANLIRLQKFSLPSNTDRGVKGSQTGNNRRD
jgi:hypothetical protein